MRDEYHALLVEIFGFIRGVGVNFCCDEMRWDEMIVCLFSFVSQTFQDARHQNVLIVLILICQKLQTANMDLLGLEIHKREARQHEFNTLATYKTFYSETDLHKHTI